MEIIEKIDERLYDLARANKNAKLKYFADPKLTSMTGWFYPQGSILEVNPYAQLVIDDDIIYRYLMDEYSRNKKQFPDKKVASVQTVENVVSNMLGSIGKGRSGDREYLYTNSYGHNCKLSRMYFKDIAGESERALLSQNLFRFLGVESYFMQGQIKRGDDLKRHAYNLIFFGDEGYVFDMTFSPKCYNNAPSADMSPIVRMLSSDEMEKILPYRTKEQHSIEFMPLIAPMELSSKNKDMGKTSTYDHK